MIRARAFSLVELLVVCALLGIVTITATSMLFGGFRVWRHLENEPLRDHWTLVAARRFEKDLRGLRRFGPVPFEGDYESFSFAGVIDEEDGPASGRLARIAYFRDDRSDSFCRSVEPFPQSLKKRKRDGCDAQLSEVKRVRLAYLGRAESGEMEWLSRWASVEPPLAVRLDLETESADRGRARNRTFLVAVPAAKLPKTRPSL